MRTDVQIAEPIDMLEIKLTGVPTKAPPVIDVFINGKLVAKDFTVSANLSLKQTDTLAIKGDFHKGADVKIVYKNDGPANRVDLVDVALNGKSLDLSTGAMTKTDGTVLAGQVKMFWNGSFDLHLGQEAAAQMSNFKPPVLQTVEIDLTGVKDSALPTVNIYINGEKVLAGYGVKAMVGKTPETVKLTGEYGDINSIQVEFTNDNGPRRIDIDAIRVNGHKVNLTDGEMLRTNGEVLEGQTKMHWNGKFTVDVADDYSIPSHSVPVVKPLPLPELPGKLHLPSAFGDVGAKEWGGVDPNKYRGSDYEGRDRAVSDPHDLTGKTLLIKAGTSVAEIKALIAAAPANQHLTLQFGEGEHHFTEKLLITRGDITIAGKGMEKTTFVADFAAGKIDNLIQIQGSDIRNDAGSNAGRWTGKESDYVGTAKTNFALGDHKLEVSSTNGLQVGDHIMVYKQGTATKTDDSDEFGSITEITGIKGNTLTLKHALAFGSNMLGAKESLANVKVYELDLLEDVTVRDFSVRYNITAKDAVNPNNLPLVDMLNTTEFNFFPKYAATDERGLGGLMYGHNRALVLSGTHEANVSNISMKDVGANGFFFSGNLEMHADNLSVDGSYNKGVGGNGYGLEFDKTYYSDFTDLVFLNLRHGLSANMLGGSGYNNFHIKDTNANLDFHGGRDQANIYYTQSIHIKPNYVPVVKNGILTPDINYDYGKVQFSLIDYRQGGVNAKENTVIWDNVTANNGVKIGSGFYNGSDKVAAFHENNNDVLMANNIGSVLKGGFGNDVLISGRGNDLLFGGNSNTAASNSDIFVFGPQNGKDVIADFESLYDQIHIALGTGVNTVQQLLSMGQQVGADVILNLGGGNNVTVLHTQLSELNEHNVVGLNFDKLMHF